MYRSAKAHGPEKVGAPERQTKDMGKDEYDKYIKQTEAQKVLIKTGYSRIKEKIKNFTARILQNGEQRLAKWSIINTSMIIRITEKRLLERVRSTAFLGETNAFAFALHLFRFSHGQSYFSFSKKNYGSRMWSGIGSRFGVQKGGPRFVNTRAGGCVSFLSTYTSIWHKEPFDESPRHQILIPRLMGFNGIYWSGGISNGL